AFAVSVRVAPGASDVLLLSDQFTPTPSIWKLTPRVVPAGVATVPLFFTVAENVSTSPWNGKELPVQEMLLMVKSMPGVNVVLSLLFVSSPSAMRFTSSTKACTVCAPAVAAHVAPATPALADNVTVCPGAKACVLVSDQLTFVPSTKNATPLMAPAALLDLPKLEMVALNVTACPGAGLAGLMPTLVTTRSTA